MFRLATWVTLILVTLSSGCYDPLPFRRNSPDLYYRSHPVGEEYFEKHGEYPREYAASRDHLEFGGAVLPNPLGEIESITILDRDNGQHLVMYQASKSFEDGDIRYSEAGHNLSLDNGQLFPYFGHILQIQLKEDQWVVLTDRTEDISSEFRPSPDCRTITLGERDVQLFGNSEFYYQPQIVKDDQYVELELLQIDAEGKEAMIRHTPVAIHRREDYSHEKTPGKAIEQTVRLGDTIEMLGHMVRVAQIVPPTESAGVGSMIGWIQLESLSEDVVQAGKLDPQPSEPALVAN